MSLGGEGGEVRAKGGGDQDDGATRAIDGRGEACQVVALGHDANIVFEGEDACGSGAKDGLVIGENESIHESCVSCGVYCPCSPLIGDRNEGWRGVCNSYKRVNR